MTVDDRPTFTARVSREDDLWVVVIDGPLPDGAIGVTDTPRFDEVKAETRDLVADLANLEESDFLIEWHYVVNGQDVTVDVLRYQDAEHDFREHSALLQAARDEARHRVLETLTGTGLSQRAMSEVVDLSQQRVNQILRARRSAGGEASAS